MDFTLITNIIIIILLVLSRFIGTKDTTDYTRIYDIIAYLLKGEIEDGKKDEK